MIDLSQAEHQIQRVTNFRDLVSTPFHGEINAIWWTRQLRGDFAEIVKKVELNDNITVLGEEELREIQLSEKGQLVLTTAIRVKYCQIQKLYKKYWFPKYGMNSKNYMKDTMMVLKHF